MQSPFSPHDTLLHDPPEFQTYLLVKFINKVYLFLLFVEKKIRNSQSYSTFVERGLLNNFVKHAFISAANIAHRSRLASGGILLSANSL